MPQQATVAAAILGAEEEDVPVSSAHLAADGLHSQPLLLRYNEGRCSELVRDSDLTRATPGLIVIFKDDLPNKIFHPHGGYRLQT